MINMNTIFRKPVFIEVERKARQQNGDNDQGPLFPRHINWLTTRTRNYSSKRCDMKREILNASNENGCGQSATIVDASTNETKRRGFTLIEMLVFIAIIAILAS